MNFLNKTAWNPLDLLLSSGSKFNYAILILNTPVKVALKTEQVLQLWSNALVRLTVDGGTDRWLTWLRDNSKGKTVVDPDLITGDMDSIRPETLKLYEKTSTRIVYTEDQLETDFTKALLELRKFIGERKLVIDYVVALYSLGGRFDQVIGNINSLYKMNLRWPEMRIFLLSNCVSWLLGAGRHRIKIPLSLRITQEWCALIPIGSKAMVTTSGLKWNLENSPLEFGYMVSTSNTYSSKDEEVFITTDSPIVWSMGIENLLISDCAPCHI